MKGLTPDFWKNGRFGKKREESRVLFGQTRDDVEVERWLITRHGGVRRALVITSGGCAALSLLDVVSDEIVSVDINPAQNRLAELKFAAWRESGADFERLLCGDGRETYERLRPQLPGQTAEFWDRNGGGFRKGLLHCGQLDSFSQMMRTLFFATVHGRRFVERYLRLDDVAEQRSVFEEEWNTWRWRTALALGFHPRLLRLTFSGPAAAFLPENFPQIMKARLRRWLTAHSARGNPYLWQSIFGTYPPTREDWPRYFQEGCRVANRDALNKVTLKDADVADVLGAEKAGSLDFISLSNVLELVPDVGAVLAAAAHASRPGGLLLSRGILPSTHSPVEGWKRDDRFFAEATAMDRGGLSLPVLLWRRD